MDSATKSSPNRPENLNINGAMVVVKAKGCTPKTPSNSGYNWDSQSLSSGISSSCCEHSNYARNGTTFSGRTMKYLVHCNQSTNNEVSSSSSYLTPTQRVQRQIKKLKFLLEQAKNDLNEKNSDILQLTKEVVELRLYKAAINSPDDNNKSSPTISSDTVTTVREKLPYDEDNNLAPNSNNNNEMTESFCTDSGHFEGTTSNKESPFKSISNTYTNSNNKEFCEQNKLIVEYERRFQELIRIHEEETYQLKQKHSEKIDDLLQKISEINNRYWQLVPEQELAKERIRELEMQLEAAAVANLKLNNNEMDDGDVSDLTNDGLVILSGPVSVPQLLEELQVTKNELDSIKAIHRQQLETKSQRKIDPEITLQFLKSAIYYFLTDKDNSTGHLKAIQSILGFSQQEIECIEKANNYY